MIAAVEKIFQNEQAWAAETRRATQKNAKALEFMVLQSPIQKAHFLLFFFPESPGLAGKKKSSEKTKIGFLQHVAEIPRFQVPIPGILKKIAQPKVLDQNGGISGYTKWNTDELLKNANIFSKKKPFPEIPFPVKPHPYFIAFAKKIS